MLIFRITLAAGSAQKPKRDFVSTFMALTSCFLFIPVYHFRERLSIHINNTRTTKLFTEFEIYILRRLSPNRSRHPERNEVESKDLLRFNNGFRTRSFGTRLAARLRMTHVILVYFAYKTRLPWKQNCMERSCKNQPSYLWPRRTSFKPP